MMQRFTDADRDKTPDNITVAYPENDQVDVETEEVDGFLAYCKEVKLPGDFADRAKFDIRYLKPWLGYIMILDYLPDRDDFRYRLYGMRIADQSGFDMTGMLVSDFESKTGDFFVRLYREAVTKRKLIYSTHTRVHARYKCDWHRVLCPVQQGADIQVVACNYPVVARRTAM